jgi:hypothetical protein
MTRQFEKEFFGLARDWLLCRLFVMGGTCPEKIHQYTLHEWIIGMHSYAGEMELLVEKEKRRLWN